MHLPERSPRAGRHAELEPGDRPARTHDPRQLAQGGGRVVDVAQEVGKGEAVELAVGERQAGRAAQDELDVAVQTAASLREHLGALVEPDHRAARPPHELARDRPGAGRHVECTLPLADVDARDEEAPPPWVLAVRQQRGVTVVRRAERREEGSGLGGPVHRASLEAVPHRVRR